MLGLIKIFCVFSFVSLLVACTGIEMEGDGGDRRGLSRGEVSFSEPSRIEDLDINELKKKTDPKKSKNECWNYEGGGNSLRLLSGFLGDKNPMTKIENCMAYIIDKSLKPICDEEKKLSSLRRKHEGDDFALEEIEEYAYDLDELKYYTLDEIYIISEEFEDLENDALDDVDEFRNSNDDNLGTAILGIFGNFAVRSEIGGFRRFFNRKARRACGYDIIAQYEEEEKNKGENSNKD